MTDKVLFADLGLSKDILMAIEKKGFSEATEIQAKVIPQLLKKTHDVIGVAQTGTGKTAAFGLPILNNIGERNKNPKAIILAPTRELALQVCSELKSYVNGKRVNILAVYGGSSIGNQIKELSRGVDIVVGTPGRVLDLIDRRKLNLKDIDYFILDEADEMLNMGFIDDIETILKVSNDEKNVLLFSATMPARIKGLAKKYMKNQLVVEAKRRAQTSDLVSHVFHKVKASQKYEVLVKILDSMEFFYGIIFCKTKRDVEAVTKKLLQLDYAAGCIHGDIAQNKREKILDRFRKQKISVLVATDVAARGIDVKDLSCVINYSLPNDVETYVHRIGRTGRAGNKGTAVSLITPAEMRLITPIEKMLGVEMVKGDLPEGFKRVVNEESQFDRRNQVDRKSQVDKKKQFGKKNQDDKKKQFCKKQSNKPRVFKGEVRLFIAKGKMDKLNKNNLVFYLEDETKIKSLKAKNVKVCEKFSFATFGAEQAEKIVDVFEKQGRKRSLVEIAS